MSANYELWYSDDLGNRIAYINDAVEFTYTRVLGDVGYLSVRVPQRGQLYDNNNVDRRIAIYRQPIGGAMSLEMIGFLRRFETDTDQDGAYSRTLSGNDLTELLARRIVAYYADSAQALQTGAADDIMKEIVRDNFIDNADYSGTPSLARDIDAYGFSVQADGSEGPSMTKGFSWRNVLTVLQDIQADSKAQGTEVFFGVIPTSETTMEFRTWTARNDRTVTSGVNPLIFSLEWGNLVNPQLVYDYASEENFIYGTGYGRTDARVVQTASDTARIGQSAFNRREGIGWSDGSTAAPVLADARNELERSRPTVNLIADLIDTPATPYGGVNGWQLGDRVTVSYAGLQFDVTIRAVNVSVSPNGNEIIKARVES